VVHPLAAEHTLLRSAMQQGDRGSKAGLDEGLLSFCLPHSCLYVESLLEEHIVLPNNSAPSYIQAAELRERFPAAEPAIGEYVIKCRFQSNCAQRCIRSHMSLRVFRLGLSLNDILADG
jgi:hypothetical protein